MDTAQAIRPAAEAEATTAAAPTATPRRHRRAVLLAASGLLLAHLVVRWWIAEAGYFYWDDLILVGRAARTPLLSEQLLLTGHDGHLMPLGFALTWAVTAIAPLVWAGPVVVMLVMQTVAALAVWRMLRILAGRRPAILIPFAFYLFTPLAIPAFAWWSAAVNALPMQFALAWVIGDAVLLVRTGRTRHALSALVVAGSALLFFEKAVLVVPGAFLVALTWAYARETPQAVRTVFGRGRLLWLGSVVMLGAWFAVYATVVGTGGLDREGGPAWGLIPRATAYGLGPALFGGPWQWERWLPSMPWADPPTAVVAASWVAVAVLAVWSVRARRRVWPLWLSTAAYLLLAELPVALARGGPDTAGELMQSLRYFADTCVVLAASMAVFLVARPRRRRHPRVAARVAAALTVLFVASSLWSTATFVRSWQISPTRTYLPAATAALRQWDGIPLLDQEVPWQVLNPVAYPDNLASRVLAPVAAPGTFARSTTRLRMFTDRGELVDAVVWWNRGIVAGPEQRCGWRIRGSDPFAVPLDGPMIEHEWTAQLNYLADRDGRITVALESGEVVAVPVTKGLHTVFVRVRGGGSALRIGSATPGLGLCVGVGPVGVASHDF